MNKSTKIIIGLCTIVGLVYVFRRNPFSGYSKWDSWTRPQNQGKRPVPIQFKK